MHVHIPVSRSMAVLSLSLFILHPFGVHGQSGAPSKWVISALHPDPTPALGAPDAEFIALHAWSADPSTLDTLSTEGLVLSWNGHERAVPPGSWPVGSTVVVHRASDSVEFTGWVVDRIGLPSWPALVNGGAWVSLSDSGWCPDRCGPVRRGGIVGRRPAPAEEGPIRLRVHGQFPTLGSSGRPF